MEYLIVSIVIVIIVLITLISALQGSVPSVSKGVSDFLTGIGLK